MKDIAYIINNTHMSLTYTHDNKMHVKTVAKTNNNYSKILDIVQDEEATVEDLHLVFNPKKIEDFDFQSLEIEEEEMFWDKMKLPPVLVSKLEKIVADGVDPAPFQAFMENLAQNPSASSISELYDFLSYKDLPITADGCFLAYKGVKRDYYSSYGNPATIVEKGTVDEGGHIYNGIGETIKVSRSQVDDDRTRECSFGLHVGSMDYARGHANIMVIVKVNPKDAVSVPKDYQFQKMRVSEYTVMADFEEEIVSATTDSDGNSVMSSSDVSKLNHEQYIEKVSDYLEGKLEDLTDQELLDGDAYIDFMATLANVGGDAVRLLDALQTSGYFWESDGSGNPSKIYLY